MLWRRKPARYRRATVLARGSRLTWGLLALLSLARCSPADVLNATVPGNGVTVTRDIAYGPFARNRLDIYQPAHAAGLPIIVFFYGGSWRSGSKAIYKFVAAPLARAGAIVVVPDYRLNPEVTYPAFLQDCAQAVAWTDQHRAAVGSTGKLFLMGHSAGAYNAVMLGVDPSLLRTAGVPQADIAGVIGLAGPYDFLPIVDPAIQRVFPKAGPDTQPITYAKAGLPPLLLLTGSEDRQVKPRNTQALAGEILAAGGSAASRTYAGLGHIGLVTAIAPIFQWRAPVLHDIIAFIHGQTAFQPPPGVPKPPHPAT